MLVGFSAAGIRRHPKYKNIAPTISKITMETSGGFTGDPGKRVHKNGFVRKTAA